MAERRRSAHAGDDQNNGGTLSKKPRDPLSSYLYRSVGRCGRHNSPTASSVMDFGNKQVVFISNVSNTAKSWRQTKSTSR